MGAFIDLKGHIINNIKIITRVENTKNNKARFLCQCHCGEKFVCVGSAIKSGNTRSCGCLGKRNRLTHGGANTKLYFVWHEMKRRCSDENHRNYRRYGGRGIKVCSEWDKDFGVFKEWATNNGYKEGLTIDRINNDDGYKPSNCRWVDMKIQSLNRYNTIHVEFNGKTMTLREVESLTGIKYGTLHDRYSKGEKLVK